MALPLLVALFCFGKIMGLAIDLNGKLKTRTIEIENVLINTILAKEPFPMHLMVFKFDPKQYF